MKLLIFRNSQNQGRNSFTEKHFQGIFLTQESRITRDIFGSSFTIQFEIIDQRKIHKKAPFYNVTVIINI